MIWIANSSYKLYFQRSSNACLKMDLSLLLKMYKQKGLIWWERSKKLTKKQKNRAFYGRTNTVNRMEGMPLNWHEIQSKVVFGTEVKRGVEEDSKEDPQIKKRSTNSPTEYHGMLLDKLDSTLQYFKKSDAKRAPVQHKREENETRSINWFEKLVKAMYKI